MTNSTEIDAPENDQPSPFRRWLGVGTLGFILIALLGFVTGVLMSAAERGGFTTRGGVLLTVAIFLIALCAWGVVRLKPAILTGEPQSKKTKRANWVLVACGVLGGVIGLTLSIAGLENGDFGVFSNGPLPPTVAIIVVSAIALLTPLLSFYWYANADEFEKRASGDGAIIAMYVYSVIAPCWWLLERAALIPPQEPMIVYLLVITVWGLVWLYRKAN
ncbi:hypothetical protein P8Q88_14575 [Qipengyuania sp. XHP0207]|uniref:hypothetical protein n=1 Tax=Qipengyuania sp. XHP0207 TaxID=3038078 RepID=UPI00241EAB16|nr:hypothetical protein [Qipengyuania sp. XHP0207]MDG5749401.1 hypothetical protein [Qipengyuania sp. XHP0207]